MKVLEAIESAGKECLPSLGGSKGPIPGWSEPVRYKTCICSIQNEVG
jgi:hypothetical protein